MKRLYTLLTLAVLCAALNAQQYSIRLTNAQGNIIEGATGYFAFTEDGKVVVERYIVEDETDAGRYVLDTLAADQLRTADYVTPRGLLWELDYAEPALGSSRHDDFGYSAVMHIRDCLTEDLTAPSSVYNWFRTCLEAKIEPDYANASIPWHFCYKAIMNCSDIIKTIDAEQATDAQKAILAEAHTIRAMLYLDMARMYEFLPNEKVDGLTARGVDVTWLTVPIVDENTPNYGNNCFVPRATKAEMVAYIEKELEQAEAFMPFVTNPSHEVPHLDVIYGLRARLALWNGEYNEAATAAEQAIQLTDTKPMTAEQMLDKQKGFNDLSLWMWGVQQDSIHNFNYNLANFTSWMSPENTEGYASLVSPAIGRSLYDRINDADPRKLLFVAPEGSALSGQTPLLRPNAYFEPYTAVKFRPVGGNTSDWEAFYTAYPLMRVEEMYLIRAEALAQSSIAQGRQALNDFMKTFRYESYNCEEIIRNKLIQEIILQKRIELWGEGQSFFDFKRLDLSVTRSYEGTNFYDGSAFNTNGRPYWMNLTFPSSAGVSNLALYGFENPQDKVVVPHPNDSFLLKRPAFLNDLEAMPFSAVYLVLDAQLPPRLAQQDEKFTMEISNQQDFNIQRTVAITGYNHRQGNDNRISFGTNSLYYSTLALLGHQGLPTKGNSTVFVRLICGDAISNTIALPLALPEKYMTSYVDYSYKPSVSFGPVGTIDCEAVAGQDLVKVLNITFGDEGRPWVRDTYNGFQDCGTFYFGNGRDNFTIDINGYVYNTYESFNNNAYFAHEDILGNDLPEYTFGDGYARIYAERNGLVYTITSDSIAIGLRFNQQQIKESRHTWTGVASLPLTSEARPTLNGNAITLEKAEDDSTLYRLTAPYQRSHNLLFNANTDGTFILPRQMAMASNGGETVFVSGTGVLAQEAYQFDLSFTDADGNVLTNGHEVFGEIVGDWELAGTGVYTYTQWNDGESERYSYYTRGSRKFKIADWCYGVDLEFQLNEDGSVTVPVQPIGYEHPTYGQVMICDLRTYTGSDNYGVGGYDPETHTFTLPVIYYVAAGYFCRGDEFFQIDGEDVGTKRQAPRSLQKPDLLQLKPVAKLPGQGLKLAPKM